jgi:hypothetical protein
MPSPLRSGLASLALLSIFLPLKADVTTINPVADTSLFEWTSNLDPDALILVNFSFGGEYDLPAGGLGNDAGVNRLARVLYKYDIAAHVPAGATITAARMRLRITKEPKPSSRPSTFALFRVLADWGEGIQFGGKPGGARAVEGDATWLYRFTSADPEVVPHVTWSVPGGARGVDFAILESASKDKVDGKGDYLFNFSAQGLIDLEDMRANPTTNFGWMLMSLSEERTLTARRWSSREAGAKPLPDGVDPEPLPELEITWIPIPVITSVDYIVDLDQISIRIEALPECSYLLLTAPSLAGPWTEGSLPTSTEEPELIFTFPATDTRQFARVEASLLP